MILPDPQAQKEPAVVKWNHYVCPSCHGITISKEFDDGVTPFMFRCRATPNCTDHARSSFYRCSQDPNQTPHVVFYRPTDRAEALANIKGYPKRFRKAMIEHWEKGGSLERKV